MKKNYAIEAITARPWAIQHDALEQICAVVLRHNDAQQVVAAIERHKSKPLADTERGTIRDGVAVVPIQGPLFPKANIFTEYCGATSCEMLALDFQAALDNPQVHSVVLLIDSPGGAVDGIAEFAAQVREARGQKEVVAYVEGLCCSAAYWIASQAASIVVAETSLIGSIGAVAVHTVREPRSGEKTFEFVSSQSPLKRVGPDSAAGAAQAQRIVDDLAAVFISTVASGRGIDRTIVDDRYGQGAVFVAADALQRGMVDAVGTVDGLQKQLVAKRNLMGDGINWAKVTAAELEQHRPDIVTSISAGAVKSERERIAQINALVPSGLVVDRSVVDGCISSGASVGEAAATILKSAKPIPAESLRSSLGDKYIQAAVRSEANAAAVTSAPSVEATKIDDGSTSFELAKKHGVL